MSAPEQRELIVDEAADGDRLDKVIAELAGTRAHAQRLIDGGNVTVDGRQHGKSRPVHAGQVILVTLPPEREPIAIDRTSTIPIVHEDDAILVVDKPAGLVVHPAPGVRGSTLVEQLAGKTAGGPAERPRRGAPPRPGHQRTPRARARRSCAAHAAEGDPRP